MRIGELVDERVPLDPRSRVSAGQCVEALIAAIIEGKHTLYRVEELLEPLDLDVAFGWSCEATNFNDTRLAKALDDVFEHGAAEIHTAVLLSAVENFDLELARLHFDTTTTKVFGDYRFSEEPPFPEDPFAIPHLTRGHSKDHRPDLKQIVLGLTVTADGGVPIAGRAVSGNRADAQEARYTLTQLARSLPDPRDVTLVADSKFFAGETLLRAQKHGLHYVTLVPRSVGIWQEAYQAFSEYMAKGRKASVLKVKAKTREGEEEYEWRGRSFDVVYRYRPDPKLDAVEIPVRAIVVESDALRARKRGSLERRREKERIRLEKRVASILKREFKCEEDAEEDAASIRKAVLTFHDVDIAVRWERVKIKRAGPGRPPKDEKPKTRKVWRVDVDVSVRSGAFESELQEASTFVLATDLPRRGKLGKSDAQILHFYDDQHKVETAMRWAKGPLAVAPIFLKTPERIGALCMVYVLALMVYALIQRDARGRLVEAGTSMPGNRGQGWTDKPTTEVLFRLFEGIDTWRGVDSAGSTLIMNTNTEQLRVLSLLGIELDNHDRGVRVVEPREPRRGERARKPRKRGKQKSKT